MTKISGPSPSTRLVHIHQHVHKLIKVVGHAKARNRIIPLGGRPAPGLLSPRELAREALSGLNVLQDLTNLVRVQPLVQPAQDGLPLTSTRVIHQGNHASEDGGTRAGPIKHKGGPVDDGLEPGADGGDVRHGTHARVIVALQVAVKCVDVLAHSGVLPVWALKVGREAAGAEDGSVWRLLAVVDGADGCDPGARGREGRDGHVPVAPVVAAAGCVSAALGAAVAGAAEDGHAAAGEHANLVADADGVGLRHGELVVCLHGEVVAGLDEVGPRVFKAPPRVVVVGPLFQETGDAESNARLAVGGRVVDSVQLVDAVGSRGGRAGDITAVQARVLGQRRCNGYLVLGRHEVGNGMDEIYGCVKGVGDVVLGGAKDGLLAVVRVPAKLHIKQLICFTNSRRNADPVRVNLGLGDAIAR
ncbi:hypothetical protein VCV18_002865 [Metarhizium anisopliae]